ncbi:nitroreductase [Marinobacter mobilis]|uniref:Nitroreductase n=1 Tax=Marinobacter mobilis TaxID=488533 RepID=A0A1H2S6N1_9GAMM|nr:nitroreductase [Marinobacter mobilis]SDW27160.1 Nitroreductase [Marinobacter mobilis]
MNVVDALYHRRSIRQFEDREIPPDVLERVLDHALQSPSGGNTQPYRIAVATGQVRQEIRDELCAKYDRASQVKKMALPLKLWHGVTGNILPDGDYNPDVKYPQELRERKFDCGMGLYETLGIERKDYQARDRQMRRNFEFFDAPAVIFVYINKALGVYSALDAGIFLQSLMLAAQEEGLGTCPQGALAVWGSPVRKRFNVDPDYKLICGLSIGYPGGHAVNRYAPEKRSRDTVILKPA